MEKYIKRNGLGKKLLSSFMARKDQKEREK